MLLTSSSAGSRFKAGYYIDNELDTEKKYLKGCCLLFSRNVICDKYAYDHQLISLRDYPSS